MRRDQPKKLTKPQTKEDYLHGPSARGQLLVEYHSSAGLCCKYLSLPFMTSLVQKTEFGVTAVNESLF